MHFDLPAGSAVPRPGDIVTTVVSGAAPFHLLADAPEGTLLNVRRTVAGDAWDRAQAASCGVPGTGGSAPGPTNGVVSLGLPTLRH